ncbi:MAG: FTR1 family protein [Candidatus Hodarchaeota archaeon]
MVSELISGIVFSFITSLREVLEAVLIIGIISSYLTLINRKDLRRDILLGVLGAIVFSFGIAWLFLNVFSNLTGYQELFEGVIMFLAAFVLSWMIIWMNKQAKNIKTEFHEKIDKVITNQQKMGIILLVFFSVAREGAELVLLLYANYLGTLETQGVLLSLFINIIGFLIGVVVATIISFILFQSTKKLDIKRFFQVTSIILVLFAAGLFAHAFHEIYEFLEMSGSSLVDLFIWTEVWNINNTILGDILFFLFGWSYDPLYLTRFEKSIIGGIIVGLFGWNDNPALIEVLGYGLYIFIAILALYRTNKPLKRTEKKHQFN